MLITYSGHAEFLLESGDGTRILTDPYDPSVGYPIRQTKADATTLSHGHADHSYISKVLPGGMVYEGCAPFRLTPHVSGRGVASFHDEVQGKKRGENTIFVLEIDGLKVAHLGDLGHSLTDELKNALQNTDILLIPVGGFYTIDGVQAAQIVRELRPKIAIPMHYKTKVNAGWPISDETPFLQEMRAQNAPRLPVMRVTREDIECFPPVVVMEHSV